MIGAMLVSEQLVLKTGYLTAKPLKLGCRYVRIKLRPQRRGCKVWTVQRYGRSYSPMVIVSF